MSVFTHPEFDGHEQVSFFHCQQTGLKAIIAVHNTNLGPALGGCRMWAYENDEQALRDVLRLSKGMTYKAAITGLPLGGGKSVIIGDSRKAKTPDMMQAMGRAVETFGGRYIIAEDVGTTVDDMDYVGKATKHVVGIQGGEHGSGDPSPMTALGVYQGIRTAARMRLKKNDLRDVRVSVQGLGNVGYNLCKLLAADGARLFVTDVQADKIEMAVKEFGATAVTLNDIYDQDVDIFAPCALGAILNDANIERLKAVAVSGAANNQLAEPKHGDVLRARNILYVPDYVLNAGGLISVFYESTAKATGTAFDRDKVVAHVETLGETIEAIVKRADQDGIATSLAADRIAEGRFGVKKASKAA